MYERDVEEAKYDVCYQSEAYAVIGKPKEHRITRNAEYAFSYPGQNSYLDVGCGRGASLDIAEQVGYTTVVGVETTEALCGGRVVKGAAYDLPFGDKSFDVTVCYDVIEHLCPQDNDQVFSELGRVTKNFLFLTICNTSSKHAGVELHINIKEYVEWDAYIREVFPEAHHVIWHENLEGAKFESWEVKF